MDEWKLRPEASDNHWFDGLVGAAMGAEMCGVVLNRSMDSDDRQKKRKVKLSEINRSKLAKC